ncbi:MerR family transcriptional regulator [Nicoliella lavandulae]|uniref:MerR family transcriptional regulator n=1 Tax=Nicoliella lavandulae TaxID=3082954 RepID=A0ABU8SKD5_9LACO
MKRLSIKQAAEQTGLSQYTIRYYTDQGLVPSIQRGPNNERLFDQQSINWLLGDHALRKTGMSIKNLKRYVQLCLDGDATINTRAEIIEQQLAIGRQKVREAQQQVEHLEAKLAKYHQTMADHNDDSYNPKNW